MRCSQVWEPPADTYGSEQIDTQDCDLSFRLVADLSTLASSLLTVPRKRMLTVRPVLVCTESEHYMRRWRHRKTALYREIQLVRQDLGALTAMIELEQKAWLSDMQQVAALLQPNAVPNGSNVPDDDGGGARAADNGTSGDSGSDDDDSDEDEDDDDDEDE